MLFRIIYDAECRQVANAVYTRVLITMVKAGALRRLPMYHQITSEAEDLEYRAWRADHVCGIIKLGLCLLPSVRCRV